MVFEKLIFLLVLSMLSKTIDSSQQRRREGCRTLASFRDYSRQNDGRRCQVLKCDTQKLLVCQPANGRLETKDMDGMLKINVMSSPEKREVEPERLERGVVGNV